jgi:hypothetical protein
LNTFHGRQLFLLLDDSPQVLGSVGGWRDLLASLLVVSQFHNVKEVASVVAPPDM